MTELFYGILVTGGAFTVVVAAGLWLDHWNRLHHQKR